MPNCCAGSRIIARGAESKNVVLATGVSWWAIRARSSTVLGQDISASAAPGRSRHIVSRKASTTGSRSRSRACGGHLFPVQRLHARARALAARPGASLPDRREGAEPTAPQGTGETDLHRSFGPGNCEAAVDREVEDACSPPSRAG